MSKNYQGTYPTLRDHYMIGRKLDDHAPATMTMVDGGTKAMVATIGWIQWFRHVR